MEERGEVTEYKFFCDHQNFACMCVYFYSLKLSRLRPATSVTPRKQTFPNPSLPTVKFSTSQRPPTTMVSSSEGGGSV